MKEIISVIFVWIISFGSVIAGEVTINLVIPKDIYSYVIEKGCEQDSKFYENHPYINSAPYKYGLYVGEYDPLQGPNDSLRHQFMPDYSFVVFALCDGKNTLLFDFSNEVTGAKPVPNQVSVCPNRIDNIENIGGLHVISYFDGSLDMYRFRDSGKWLEKNEKGTILGNGILSEYDGSGYIFYCFSGRWISKTLD